MHLMFDLFLADSAGITGEGSIAQVSFEVRGWDPLTSPLRITGVIANDVETNEEVGIGVVDGTFTVGAMLGDCNGDGEINGADALLALSMAIGRAEENLVCDANEDGSVTSLDARLILQASVGIGESRLWGPPDSFPSGHSGLFVLT